MPPLNALKAFEAAARHASFARAAEELGVTPAAVSHQVKALEGWIGAPLFVRRAQGLGLTDLGRATLPGLSAAFDAMGRAVQDLRGAAPRAQVDIAALPAIAQLWLAPRLSAARAVFPGLRASVHALETPPDLRRELFDLAIFYVRDAPPGCRTIRLGADAMFPVCVPSVAGLLGSPSDLASVPLLRDTTWTDDWACWLAAASAGRFPIEAGPAFSLYSMAVQAALDGAGVLMGHEALIGEHLASGALIAPFPAVAHTGSHLAILMPERAPAEVVRLVEWLAA